MGSRQLRNGPFTCPHCLSDQATIRNSDLVHDDIVRYRKCKSCNTITKTTQQLYPTKGKETIVPHCTKREHGERRGKLDVQDVRRIRKLLADALDQNLIAERFGVSRCCIYDIRVGRKWGHVT